MAHTRNRQIGRRAVDPDTHHWPGCAQAHRDCRCYWLDVPPSAFDLALRDGDRAIAAMVADTSTHHAPDLDLDASTVIVLEVFGTIDVTLRPGMTIARPARRIRALSNNNPAALAASNRKAIR